MNKILLSSFYIPSCYSQVRQEGREAIVDEFIVFKSNSRTYFSIVCTGIMFSIYQIPSFLPALLYYMFTATFLFRTIRILVTPANGGIILFTYKIMIELLIYVLHILIKFELFFHNVF